MSENEQRNNRGPSTQQLCKKCHGILDDRAWCGYCAARRQMILGLCLVPLLPILGFGVCISGYGRSGEIVQPFLVIGMTLFYGGPFIGLAVFGIGRMLKKRRE